MTNVTTIEIRGQLNHDEALVPELKPLLDACRKGDRLAQKQLYERYYGKLMGLCMRYFENRDDALDALNRGFLKVLTQLDQYDRKYEFDGWAYRIVQRTAIDLLRTHIRRKDKYPEAGEVEVVLTSTVMDKLKADDLIKVLDCLSPVTRLVFNLFAIEGYLHKEIAELLDISVNTSKWHVNAARKQLKDKLKHYAR